MDFALTDEQRALQQMARELFAKISSPDRLRALWDGQERGCHAWQALAELGLTGLGVPAEYGGSGGDAVDIALLLEEAGRACAAEPVLDTIAVAGPFLAANATESVKQRWLPGICSGDVLVSVQSADHPHAVDADEANLLLIEVDGVIQALASGDFSARQVASEDRSRRLFTVEHDGGEPVGPAEALLACGALGTAALLNGIAGALLDMTLEYVKVRRQFDAPVGSFQAVKHKLATVHAVLESSTAATLYAAYTAARRLDDLGTAASVAKVHAVDAESLANAEALQCHAGIGFTWEHDLHFWLKRGLALEHAYGSARAHRARVAAALLD